MFLHCMMVITLCNENIFTVQNLYPFNEVSGRVEVFANKNGSWEKLGTTLTNQLVNESFGASLSLNLDGSIIGVGSRLPMTTKD